MSTPVRRPPAAAPLVAGLSAVLLTILTASSGAGAAAPPDAGAAGPRADEVTDEVTDEITDEVTWGVSVVPDAYAPGRAHFDYALAPGDAVDDALLVSNHSDRAITLDVYATDAFTSPNGALDLLGEDDEPTGVGTWVTLGTDRLDLGPGQSAELPFTLVVPADAGPGDHSGGIVTSLVGEHDAAAVQVDHRLGSRVYVRVTGDVVPTLAVTDLHADYAGTLDPTGTGDVTLTYTVTNTGNVRLGARQSATVAGPLGLLARGTTGPDLPEILPGDSLDVSLTVPGVWPTVRLSATVEVLPVAGAGAADVAASPVRAAATVWAPPWGQGIVLLVLALGVLGWWLLRRRRRRAVDAAITAAVQAALGDRRGQEADAEVR